MNGMIQFVDAESLTEPEVREKCRLIKNDWLSRMHSDYLRRLRWMVNGKATGFSLK